jgi:hypothetical protein
MDRCRQFLRPGENWPVTATMRRVDVGHADDVPGILAELADRDAAAQ